MRKRLRFKNYLNEAKQLKLGLMPQVVRLQRQYDYVEWHEQVNAFWRRALRDNQATLGTDIELIEEVKEEEESEQSSNSDSSGDSSSGEEGEGSDGDDQRAADSNGKRAARKSPEHERKTDSAADEKRSPSSEGGPAAEAEGAEKMDQRRGVAAAAMSTPDKKRKILPHGSQSRSQSRSKNKTNKSRLPVVKETRTVEVQGLKFTLLKNQKGGEFAEKVCGRKKVELVVMK